MIDVYTAPRTDREKPDPPGSLPRHVTTEQGGAPDGGPETLVGARPEPRRRRPRLMLGLAAGAVALLALAWLGQRYFTPHLVPLAPVTRGNLVIERKGPGTLDALERSAISAKAQGRIVKLLVDQNDVVRRGQLIAEIASDDIRQDLDGATASLQAAQLATDQLRAEKQRTAAALENAQRDYARQQALFPQGATSRASFDAAASALRQAEAGFAGADAAVRQMEKQENAAAAVAQGRRVALRETLVLAPYDGVVISRNLSVGALVTPGAPIVQLASPKSIVFSARFDETTMAAFETGQPAEIRFASQPETPVTGTVLRLDREVDQETREFTLVVVPTTLPRNWAVGQRGSATVIVSSKPDVLTVPASMVVWREGGAGFWVVKGDRAHWQFARLGAAGTDMVEILEGLTAGDQVMAPAGVFEGMLVDRSAH